MFRCWPSEKSVAKQAGVVNKRRSEKADQKALDEGDHNQKGSRAVESGAAITFARQSFLVSHFDLYDLDLSWWLALLHYDRSVSPCHAA